MPLVAAMVLHYSGRTILHHSTTRTNQGDTMSFIEDLKKLKENERSLIEKKNKIIETRKNEIGKLAEKLELLETDNAIIAGALMAIKSADKDLLAGFENDGKRFLEPRKYAPKIKEDKASSKSK